MVTSLIALALLAGCTTQDSQEAEPSTQSSAPTPAALLPPDAQHLPTNWDRVPWERDRFPAKAVPAGPDGLPGVLDEPAPAVLAYHATERMTDPSDWSSEVILFLGADGRWRRLDLAELGLPAAWHLGSDTYGAGALSADGRIWASHTDAGVVLVDLVAGTSRHVDLPEPWSHTRRVSWLPGRNVASAYAAKKRGGASYRTFQVNLAGRVTRVPYDGSNTRLDVDGTPVGIERVGQHRFAVTRWPRGGHPTTSIWTWTAPIPSPGLRHPFAVFGDSAVALQSASWPRPGQVWVLDKGDGRPLARLALPAPSEVLGWQGPETLLLLVDNHWIVTWNHATGRVHRLLELPGPYPEPAEWAAATVALPTP